MTVFADTFATGVFTVLTVGIGALLLLGLRSPRRTGDITDKKQHRAWGTMHEIEERDVGSMVDGVNDRRRARGAADLDEGDLRDEVERQQVGRLASDPNRDPAG
ncbi:MAG TPA: hypothetical protein VF533_06500 [Solirubrobacteraceae bacterium]|jgi:hypothetical protein